MRQLIPYKKVIDLKNNIYEITTISLEHELNIKDDEILGDFIISGEYKNSEVSVNPEKFLHRIPFSIEYANRFDKDSVDFSINNFEYEVENNNLIVNIEVSVDVKELEIPYSDPLDIPIPSSRENELNINMTKEVEKKEHLDSSLLNKSDSDDVFVTYHVHIVRENETLETISLKYNVNSTLISELNKIDTANIGQKLIIPISNEWWSRNI